MATTPPTPVVKPTADERRAKFLKKHPNWSTRHPNWAKNHPNAGETSPRWKGDKGPEYYKKLWHRNPEDRKKMLAQMAIDKGKAGASWDEAKWRETNKANWRQDAWRSGINDANAKKYGVTRPAVTPKPVTPKPPTIKPPVQLKLPTVPKPPVVPPPATIPLATPSDDNNRPPGVRGPHWRKPDPNPLRGNDSGLNRKVGLTPNPVGIPTMNRPPVPTGTSASGLAQKMLARRRRD